MKKLLQSIFDGIGQINMLPDTRHIDDILKDYRNDSDPVYVVIGFLIILLLLFLGFYLIINGHDITGSIIAIFSLALWTYAQYVKISKRKKNQQ